MEVIRLSGYTEDEKVHIAAQYLLPKQFKANGLKEGELDGHRLALRDITRYYTREAGVRGLDRELAKICRKVVKSILTKKKEARTITVNAKNLDKYLGVRKYTYGIAEKENQIGQVTGLAWTEVGGELLTVEAVKRARQGQHRHHRQAGRGDAGVDQGRHLGGARARQAPRHRRGLLPEPRPAHPPARGRDAQGRPQRRHRASPPRSSRCSPASRCAATWR